VKILIVDDSPLVRAILKDFLVDAGYEVFEAGTFSEADSQFSQIHPEIIIKDLYMHEWDAIESIRFFKSRDSKVKIIICSTSSSKSTIIEGLKAGAQDFLLKPLNKTDVLDVLKRLAFS
jgi:Response regulator containing CheY-like receiver, AAA-type ATPase, and DNA-binding domains